MLSYRRFIVDAFHRHNSKKSIISYLDNTLISFRSTNSRNNCTSQPIFRNLGFQKRFYSSNGNKIELFKPYLPSTAHRLITENQHKINFSMILLGCGAVITLTFGSKETVPYTNRSHFVLLSNSLEKRLGESLFKSFLSKYKGRVRAASDPTSVRVSEIARKIIEVVESDDENNAVMKGLKWEVVVVDDPTVNAFCSPGGKIVVFTGLLKHFTQDVEIATIIGHEVGHAVARHIAERFNKFLWLCIIRLIFYQFFEIEAVNDTSKLFLSLPNSRKAEMEADYIGLVLMASAGYDPRRAPDVYKKIGKIGIKTTRLDDYFSTHPSGEKRSKLLSQAKVMDESTAIYEKVKTGLVAV